MSVKFAEQDRRHDLDHLTLAQLLRDRTLAFLFREFLHEKQASENLSFWLEVDKWSETQRKGHSEETLDAAEEIIMKYFGAEGIKTPTYGEVNLDDNMKERIIDLVQEQSSRSLRHEKIDLLAADLFTEAQNWVFQMMEDDVFRKFLVSSVFFNYKEHGIVTNEKKPEVGEEEKNDKEKKRAASELCS